MTGKRALYRRKPCTETPCSVLYLVGIYKKYLEHKLVISRDTAFEMHEYEITKEDIAAIEAEEGERYVD